MAGCPLACSLIGPGPSPIRRGCKPGGSCGCGTTRRTRRWASRREAAAMALHRSARLVTLADHLALRLGELGHAIAQRRQIALEGVGLAAGRGRHALDQLVVEHQPAALAEPVAAMGQHLVVRHPAGQGVEVLAPEELVELLPHHQVGLLQHVVGLVGVENQRHDVGVEPGLAARQPPRRTPAPPGPYPPLGAPAR